MARARLHIICGNCGCNDMFTYEIDYEGTMLPDSSFKPVIYIRCGNCSTLHDLEDTIEEKQE